MNDFAAVWEALPEATRDEVRDLADERANGERGNPSQALVAALSSYGLVSIAGFGPAPESHVPLVSSEFLEWALEQP